MKDDQTEFAIEAITKVIEDPDERRAVARIMRRNSMVSKILIWVVLMIFAGFLTAIGAYIGGMFTI